MVNHTESKLLLCRSIIKETLLDVFLSNSLRLFDLFFVRGGMHPKIHIYLHLGM